MTTPEKNLSSSGLPVAQGEDFQKLVTVEAKGTYGHLYTLRLDHVLIRDFAFQESADKVADELRDVLIRFAALVKGEDLAALHAVAEAAKKLDAQIITPNDNAVFILPATDAAQEAAFNLGAALASLDRSPTPTAEKGAAPSAEDARYRQIEGHCSAPGHEGVPFFVDTADDSGFCPLCEYEVLSAGGSLVALTEAPTLTGDQWLRITQVHELVKQEGDAQCEAAFDDLIAIHNALSATLARARTTQEEN